jgi:Protein of unknown function (DUF2934)
MREEVLQDKLDAAIHSHIRRRAYELYETRGCLEGFDLEDWLQAEREVQSELKSGEAMSLPPEERKSRVAKRKG